MTKATPYAVAPALLLCAALARSGWAQAEYAALRTETVRGVVRDAAKQGVAGAEVVLWLGVGPHEKGAGIEDVVRVQCDKRGRFRAKVLAGYSYSASATWSVDGRAKAAEIVEGVRSGVVLRMSEAAGFEAARKLSVRVRSAVSFADDALRLRVSVGKAKRYVVFDGKVERGKTTPLEIPFAGENGMLNYELFAGSLLIYRARTNSSKVNAVLKFYDPLAFRVTDADGKPVAAAVLDVHYGQSENAWREFRETDAEGRASVPRSTRLASSMRVRVRAPGHACEVYSFSRTHMTTDPGPQVKIPEQIDVRLRAAEPTALRVLGLDGAPLAGALVRIKASYTLKPRKNASTRIVARDWARSDAEGRVRLTTPRTPHERSATLVLPPRTMAALQERAGAFPCPPAFVAWEVGTGVETEADLRTCVLHKRSFVLPDRSPARAASIYTASGSRTGVVGKFDANKLPRCDRRGRFTWFARKGARPKARFAFVPGLAWVQFGTEHDEELLVLKPVERRLLRVKDTKGEPVAGARLYTSGTSWSGSGDLIDFVWKFNSAGLQGRTGEDGTLGVVFIADAGIRYRMAVSAPGNKTAQTNLPESSDENWTVVVDPVPAKKRKGVSEERGKKRE